MSQMDKLIEIIKNSSATNIEKLDIILALQDYIIQRYRLTDEA
jgi:hypothetical protein